MQAHNNDMAHYLIEKNLEDVRFGNRKWYSYQWIYLDVDLLN